MAFIVLTVLMLGTMGFWAAQRRLIYFPDRSTPGAAPDGWVDVTYPTADGLTLAAWYRAPEAGQPVVVVFAGNAGNRAARTGLGTSLAAAGLGVLLTDYRGYGGNPGEPSERGLAADARGALAFVGRVAPGSARVYFGESLGAAVAVEVSGTEPPAALVLRSPFTSLADVGRHHYPWLPISAMLRDRYPSVERIGSVDSPVLVIAGDADTIVPVHQSREVYDAVPGRKRLLVIAGADHNDPVLAGGREIVEAVVAFVAEATGT